VFVLLSFIMLFSQFGFCAYYNFLCALISWPTCARTRA